MKNSLLIIFFVTALVACSDTVRKSPEERVKQTLDEIELAAEARSLSAFMQHINDDYRDHQGNNKDAIRRIIQLQFIRNQNIHILSSIQSLSIQDDIATVELSAVMAASETDLNSNNNTLKADSHRFSIVLRSPDQQQTWLLDSVSWKRSWE